jgi:hypothetical protein
MSARIAGSHTTLALLDEYAVTIVDNLDNSFMGCYERLQQLAGDKAANLAFHKVSRQCRNYMRMGLLRGRGHSAGRPQHSAARCERRAAARALAPPCAGRRPG